MALSSSMDTWFSSGNLNLYKILQEGYKPHKVGNDFGGYCPDCFRFTGND